jgi:acyl-CoA synthetase (AMP-forming)/AMP-acid ligase II
MSLISEFATVAKQRPEQTALITEKSQLSYQDLINLVQAFDIELAARGLRTGDTVIINSSRAEFCITMALLLSYRGLTVIYTTAQQALDAKLDFDYVISTDAPDGIPDEKNILIDSTWFGAMGTYPAADFRSHNGPEGTFIMQSSGSTGVPKFIVTSEPARLHSAKFGHESFGVSLTGRRFSSSLSPRSGWSITGYLSALLSGGSIVALDEKRADIALYIDLYRVDALVTTPAILANLITNKNTGQFLTSLRTVRIGGATTGQQLLTDFSKICDAKIYIGYGAAETGTLLTYTHDTAASPPEGFLGTPINDGIEISPVGNIKYQFAQL